MYQATFFRICSLCCIFSEIITLSWNPLPTKILTRSPDSALSEHGFSQFPSILLIEFLFHGSSPWGRSKKYKYLLQLQSWCRHWKFFFFSPKCQFSPMSTLILHFEGMVIFLFPNVFYMKGLVNIYVITQKRLLNRVVWRYCKFLFLMVYLYDWSCIQVVISLNNLQKQTN